MADGPTGPEALKEVAKRNGKWNWVMVGANVKTLPFSGCGTGGIQELMTVVDKRHSFGLLRLAFGQGKKTRPIWICIHYSDEVSGDAMSIKERKKAMEANRMESAISEFALCNMKLRLSSPEECTLSHLVEELLNGKLLDVDASVITEENIYKFNPLMEEYRAKMSAAHPPQLEPAAPAAQQAPAAQAPAAEPQGGGEESKEKQQEDTRRRQEAEAQQRQAEEVAHRQQEEERKGRLEQEAQRRQAEEAAKKRQEEEEAQRREAEEEERKHQAEEESRRRREEEEVRQREAEDAKQRQAEEEARRHQEQLRHHQEEEEAQKRQAEEEARQRKEEEERNARQEEEEAKRRREEEEQEEARRRQEREEAEARRLREEEEERKAQIEGAVKRKQEAESKLQQVRQDLTQELMRRADTAKREHGSMMRRDESNATAKSGRSAKSGKSGRREKEEEARKIAEKNEAARRRQEEVEEKLELLQAATHSEGPQVPEDSLAEEDVPCLGDNCGNMLLPDALFCRKCGTPRHRARISLLLGAQEVACVSCGNMLLPDADFCRKCGTPRPQGSPSPKISVIRTLHPSSGTAAEDAAPLARLNLDRRLATEDSEVVHGHRATATSLNVPKLGPEVRQSYAEGPHRRKIKKRGSQLTAQTESDDDDASSVASSAAEDDNGKTPPNWFGIAHEGTEDIPETQPLSRSAERCQASRLSRTPSDIAEYQRRKVRVFAVGDLVEVWSSKYSTWIPDAEVIETISTKQHRDGLQLRAGSMKVLYSGGQRFKWVPPQLVGEHLRISRRPKPPEAMIGKLLKEVKSKPDITDWIPMHVEVCQGFVQWWEKELDAKGGAKSTGHAYLIGLHQVNNGVSFKFRTDSTHGNVHTFRSGTEEEAKSWINGLWDHEHYAEDMLEYKRSHPEEGP